MVTIYPMYIGGSGHYVYPMYIGGSGHYIAKYIGGSGHYISNVYRWEWSLNIQCT